MALNIIYGLMDPREKLIRYVGKTTQGLKRIGQHTLPSAMRDNTWKNNWLKSLLHDGVQVEACVLEEVPTPEMLSTREVWWIAYGNLSGWRLTNLTPGGDGVTNHAQVTRDKISRALKGRPAHTNTVNNLRFQGQLRKELGFSELHKLRISAAKRGKPLSEAHRLALSYAKDEIGRWSFPLRLRRKMRRCNRGIHVIPC